MNYYFLTAKLVLRYLNQHKLYWMWFVFRAIFVLLEVISPVIFGQIVNILVLENHSWNDVQFLIWLYIALLLVTPGMDSLTAKYTYKYSVLSGAQFRKDNVALLKSLPLKFWEKNKKGAVIQIMNSSGESVTDLAFNLPQNHLRSIGKLLGIFTISFFITPVILIVFAIDTIFFIVNIVIFSKKGNRQGLLTTKKYEGMNGALNEHINNFRTVVYLNLFRRQEEKFNDSVDIVVNNSMKSINIGMVKWFNNNQLHNVSIGVILIYSVLQVLSGDMQVGTLTTLILFANTYTGNLSVLVQLSESVIRNVNTIQRYYEKFGKYLNLKLNENETTITTQNFKNISIENVTSQDSLLLKNVNLKIKAGEKIAVIGYTGSGKSTLLDILLKVVTKYSGRIFINKHDYNELSVKDIVTFFSIVPQDVQLFKDTVKNNVVLDTEISDDDLSKILEVVELTKFVNNLQNGLETKITEGSTNISGGERQRIGIARALAQKRQILILDEATASLDPKTERKVITNIISSFPDLTLIYVTHKYSLLNYFENIVVMSDGRIVEQGKLDDLKKNNGLFNDLFEASKTED